MNDQIFKSMAQSIIDGEAEEAEKLALQAIELGIDPLDAINKGFVVGVDHVGDLFSLRGCISTRTCHGWRSDENRGECVGT